MMGGEGSPVNMRKPSATEAAAPAAGGCTGASLVSKTIDGTVKRITQQVVNHQFGQTVNPRVWLVQLKLLGPVAM